MQSFIFYNDRLLLRKDAEGHFHVPDETELSGKLTGQTMRHEVLLPNGHTIHTAAIEFSVEEDDQWLMVGLRASFDYVTLAEYTGMRL